MWGDVVGIMYSLELVFDKCIRNSLRYFVEQLAINRFTRLHTERATITHNEAKLVRLWYLAEQKADDPPAWSQLATAPQAFIKQGCRK